VTPEQVVHQRELSPKERAFVMAFMGTHTTVDEAEVAEERR
jgi:hypothetical protein